MDRLAEISEWIGDRGISFAAPFEPAGDQPEAIKQLVEGLHSESAGTIAYRSTGDATMQAHRSNQEAVGRRWQARESAEAAWQKRIDLRPGHPPGRPRCRSSNEFRHTSRLFDASVEACEKLVYVRSGTAKPSVEDVKVMLSVPKKSASTAPDAPLSVPCAAE